MTEAPVPGIPTPPIDRAWKFHERAYYKCGGIFIKRSLLPDERKIKPDGTAHVPLYNQASLYNEARSLAHIAKHTTIPVPKVHDAFENNGCFFLLTEFVEGVEMYKLSESQKRFVKHHLVY